ncbi:ATP-binding protein [Candidatus Woesearchaeota archaeon]|nr:ATP-binding protein [Candidatus Woesearchaeota archaeon]
MILGRIVGKSTTNDFFFHAEKEPKKFQYVQVMHPSYGYVLAQVVEILKEVNATTGFCQIIGFKEDEKVKKLRIPLDIGSEVLEAEDDFIEEVIKINVSNGAFIGELEGKNIKVFLDLNKVLSMHLAVLAKSGSGKSYAVGVLLEEMIRRNIPLLIIDPHGEYSSLRFKNDVVQDLEKLSFLDLKPESFEVIEFGDSEIVKGCRPLRLSRTSDKQELVHLMPGKMSNTQLAILFSALKTAKSSDFDSIMFALESEESSAKWSIMSMVEHLKDMHIFSGTPVPYSDFLKPGKATIINLKGINPDVQEVIVFKLCKDLFELRKKNKVPPFFLVLEEAHNYCPERSFGETKASKIIRNIASEGRKFGLGLCAISQRPARVDKSVLSQCSTQLILKVTNPNDLKALSASVEGLTGSVEKEIQNLPIGTALVTGLTDVPLFVNIRPRMSLHGGKAHTVISESSSDFLDKVSSFEEEKVMPLIKHGLSHKDLRLMSDSPIGEIRNVLIPCKKITCKDKEGEYSLLIELVNGEIIINKDDFVTKKIPDLKSLDDSEISILRFAFRSKEFKEQDLIKQGFSLGVNEKILSLLNKGFLINKNDSFVLCDDYVFSKLSKLANHDDINFESVSFSEEKQVLVDVDSLLDKLRGFTNVVDDSDCFVVKYEPEYL